VENREERTERATPQRRQKAREKGQIARSRELTSTFSLGAVVVFLQFGGVRFYKEMSQETVKFLSLEYGTDLFDVLRIAMVNGVFLLIPLFGLAALMAAGGGFAQGGFVMKPLKLELNAVNPIEGLKKKFSMNSLSEAVKITLKFLGGALLFYYLISGSLSVLPYLSTLSLESIAWKSGELVLSTIMYGFFFFFLISIISYILERKKFERSIKMSKQEIKEEFKETEGDPMIKSRIRSLQIEMARRRMMQEVPTSTVVITNPVHLAVALRYDDGAMHAPKIVAKGSAAVAERIKEKAREHGVPVVEDKPIARMLFKLEVDSYIPEELYKSVARIIAYIYGLRGKQ
jgi:flagellar biosynthetic protein FlhB